MFDAIREDLVRLLETYRPGRLLIIDPEGRDAVAPYLDRHETEVIIVAPEDIERQIEAAGHVDLALVRNTIEHLERDSAVHILSRLRDLYARRVFVQVPMGSDWPGHTTHWQQRDLLGYGFTRIGRYEHKGHPVHLYGFDIDNYKITPDWLNARNWANPELFNKYRW